MLAGTAGSAGKMVRSIRFEMLLMVLVVAAAASLTLPTPPRALADQAAAGANNGAPVGLPGEAFKASWTENGYTAEVELSPGTTQGENMFMVRFKDAAGKPVTMVKASLDLALPAASLSEIVVDGQGMPPDMFHFMTGDMIVPGEWDVTVNAFVDDFTKITISGKVPVR